MDPGFLREQYARKTRASRVKLVLMVVALVALAAGMFRMASKQAGQADDVEDQKPVSTDVVDRSPPIHLIGEGKAPGPLAVSADEVAKKFPAMANDDVLKTISDQDTSVEPGPFFRMLYRVSQDDYDKAKTQAQADVLWQTLWDKPATVRGQVVRVRGQVVRIWPQPLGTNPMGLEKVWVYRIREDGAPLNKPDHFYDVYAIDKLHGAMRYDHVTTFGRFLKAQIIEPESARFLDDPDLHVAVVVTRRFEPLTYLDEPTVPKPVRADSRPEARALYYLLKRARDTAFVQLEATASTKLSYLDFMNHADRLCGKPVVIKGELRRCVRMSLPENVLNLPDIYYGQVVDVDRKMNTFYALHVPTGLHLKDPVLVYGYYLKNWSYVSQSDQVISSPVIAAQRLVLLEYEKSYTLEIILGVVVAGTVGVLFIAYTRERSRQIARNEARRQRQLDRLPKNLNEVARNLAARAQEPDEPPGSDDA